MLLYNAPKLDTSNVKSFQELGGSPTTGDVAGAQIDTFMYENLHDSREQNINEEVWSEIVKVRNLAPEIFGPASVPQTNPNAPKILQEAWNETAQGTDASRASDWEGYIEPQVEELKKRFPDANIRNRDEIDADIAAQAKVTRDTFNKIYERADTFEAFWGVLGGGVVGAMNDSINIMTLPLGAGRVATGSFLRSLGIVVGKNFAIGVGIEAAIQPFVYDYKKEIESPYDLYDAVFAMGAAGAGMGLLNGLGHTIGRGIRTLTNKGKIPDTPNNRAMLRQFEKILAAQRFADQSGAKTVAELEIHLKALTQAMIDVRAGKPIDFEALAGAVDRQLMENLELEFKAAGTKVDAINKVRDRLMGKLDDDGLTVQTTDGNTFVLLDGEVVGSFKLSEGKGTLKINDSDLNYEGGRTTGLSASNTLESYLAIAKAHPGKKIISGKLTEQSAEIWKALFKDGRATRSVDKSNGGFKYEMTPEARKYLNDAEAIELDSLNFQLEDFTARLNDINLERLERLELKEQDTNAAQMFAPDGESIPSSARALEIEQQVNQMLAQLGALDIRVRIHEGNPELDGDLRYSLADGGVSTRVPTAKRATEDALTEDLLVGSDVDLADPITLAKNTAKIEQYDGYIPQVKNETPEQVAANFIAQLKDNLLWLHDQVPDDIRQRSHKWYVGANRITEGFAARYGYSNEQASGVMAALSPQKDWFMNASLGERVMDVYANHQNTTWSPEMEFVATDPTIIKNKDGDYPAGILIRNEVNAKLYEAIQGKKLSELDDVYEISAWIRSFDEAHNNRSHRVVTPEGGFIEYAAKLDGTDKVTGWGSFSEISKAVSVLRDGSPENISNQMGGMHKVRNFYNNILLPNSVNGHVTIDTHAVAASMLGAFSTKSTEVKHNFGQGSSSSSITGSKGTYGLHAEAYRQAAAARGILPRQMQSITWEAARGLFTAGFKGKAENVKLISGIWQRHKKGKITLDEARQEILNAADGINDPAWHRSSGRVANEEWDSSYKGDIPTGGLPRNTRLDEATGPRVGDDATRASSDPDGGVRYSKDGQTIEAAINPETGELHINASAFRDEAHLMEVMREEIIGHYGLRKSLGGDFQGVIDDIKSTATTNPELRQMWIDLSGVDPQTKTVVNTSAPYRGMADDVIADEIISKMAREEISDTTWLALKNILIKALRKIGLIKEDITISEMKALVVRSEAALKKNLDNARQAAITRTPDAQPTATPATPATLATPLKNSNDDMSVEGVNAEVARILNDESIPDGLVFDHNGNSINIRDALMEVDNELAGIESIRVCML
jgi:hypothetical protein